MNALKKYWGYDQLRGGQAQAVRAVLQRRDSLLVMPTGGGKSLCFQLPAVVMGRLCVVVSPLIALMKDQVDGLVANGYPAAALYSGQDDNESERIEAACAAGEIKLIYVSAKRIASPGFVARFSACGVAAIFIDEAHCISQWGHDFIPEYRRLALLAKTFPGASIHAFTATATPRVREDICDQLRLRSPQVMVGTFDRPNLTYRVVSRNAGEGDEGRFSRKRPGKAGAVPYAKQVAKLINEVSNGAVIVYCIRRADTEGLAAALVALGVEAKAYHAGLDHGVREAVQRAFMHEKLNVVVATVAFGMGIDRSDVRRVIHANLPKSIEAYQQETGRAGRDGLPSTCYLLYHADDADAWRYLIKQSASGVDNPTLSAVIRKQQEVLLESMLSFAISTGTCRHRTLSAYFGQDYPRTFCGACDVCHSQVLTQPHAGIGRIVLRAVVECSPASEVTSIMDLLTGSPSAAATGAGLHLLPTFGLLHGFTAPQVSGILSDLSGAGLVVADEQSKLQCTPVGLEFLRSDDPLELPSLIRAKSRAARPPRRPSDFLKRVDERERLTRVEKNLRTRLREVRARLAGRRGVAPFMLFDENTLLALVRMVPQTSEKLQLVPGLSAAKIEDIGEHLVQAIVHFMEESQAHE